MTDPKKPGHFEKLFGEIGRELDGAAKHLRHGAREAAQEARVVFVTIREDVEGLFGEVTRQTPRPTRGTIGLDGERILKVVFNDYFQSQGFSLRVDHIAHEWVNDSTLRLEVDVRGDQVTLTSVHREWLAQGTIYYLGQRGINLTKVHVGVRRLVGSP